MYISLIVLFLHATTWDGNIFAGIKTIIKPKGNLYKPLYGCPICMTPYYGSFIYYLYFYQSWQNWVLTVFTAAGLSVVWVLTIDIKDSIKPLQKLKKGFSGQ